MSIVNKKMKEAMEKKKMEEALNKTKAKQESVPTPSPKTFNPVVIEKEEVIQPEVVQVEKPRPTFVPTPTPMPVHTPSGKLTELKTDTPLLSIMNQNLPPGSYAKQAWKSNFDIWNKDLKNFIRNFSTENQENGGGAITKSQMLEILIEFVHYNVGVEPVNEKTGMGFQNPHELREYLQEKWNNR